MSRAELVSGAAEEDEACEAWLELLKCGGACESELELALERSGVTDVVGEEF